MTFDTAGDENSDDQSVDSNNTGHDNRNDGLHDQVRPHDTHCCDTCSRLGSSISSTKNLSLKLNYEKIESFQEIFKISFSCADNLPLNTIADTAPIMPKNGP